MTKAYMNNSNLQPLLLGRHTFCLAQLKTRWLSKFQQTKLRNRSQMEGGYSSHYIPKWVECSPMAQKTGLQSQVGSYQRLKKWYLIPLCLTFSIIRYISRVKWSNPRKGVAPSPFQYCSYWKSSHWVALNYAH